jgi:hypothetical protein
MDAVVFMEAVKTSNEPSPPPPPPSERKPQGITANAALIAGIGTLVLAIGVGVLIGRSGDNGSATAANAAPQIIKVGGGGGNEEAAPEGEAATGKKKSKSGGKSSKKASGSKADKAGEEAAEEILKPSGEAKPLPKAGTQLGGDCEQGTAGCKNGEFNGEFFGE